MRQKPKPKQDFESVISQALPQHNTFRTEALMTARTYTHTETRTEEKSDGQKIIITDFSITVREALGRDIGNAYFMRLTIRDHEKKQRKLGEKDSLPDALWENIHLIANAINQTVNTSGALPFKVPSYTDPIEDITAFYDCLLDLPARYLAAFSVALRKVSESPVPLSTGAKNAPNSASESKPA
jgi:hypothetical protein